MTLDYNNLTDGLPTSRIYSDLSFTRIQKLEYSIHTATNKIYIADIDFGIYTIDRATGESSKIDPLAGEAVTYTKPFVEDIYIDDTNDLLYAIVARDFRDCGTPYVYGLLELNLSDNSKRWIRSDSPGVSLPTDLGLNDGCGPSDWGVNKIYLEKANNVLYVSTTNGIWWWNRTNNNTGLYSTDGGISLQTGSPNLPSNKVTHVYIDQSNNKFYAGTHEGLFVWDRNTNTSRVYNKGNSAMIDNLVNHIDQYKEGNLLFVACEFGGLFTLNTATGEEKLYSVDSGIENEPHIIENDVAAAWFDEVDKKLYVSTWNTKGSVWIRDYSNVALPTPSTYLESECATIGSNWQTVDDPSAAGGQYLVYPNGTGNSPNRPPTNPADHVTFSVNLTTPGPYNVLARLRAPTSSDDSFWVRVNDGAWEKWTGGVKTVPWAWKKIMNRSYTLTAGLNTVTFAHREDGTQLDKLYVTTTDTPPDGVGEADTLCTTGSDETAYWRESECATVGSYWDEQDDPDASNGTLLQVNTNYSGGLGQNDPRRRVTFTLEVAQAGDYHLFARHFRPGGASSSFLVRVNDGAWQTWTAAHGGALAWTKVLTPAFALRAGENTVSFCNRTIRSQLDKVALTRSEVLPTGLGEVDSTCVDDYVPPAPPTVNNPPDATTAPAVATGRSIPRNSNATVNYVRSFTPRQPYSDAGQVSLARSVDQVSVSTEYLDGLGRPIQTVVRGGSGSAAQDLVQPVAYDAYGRPAKQHLPYAAPGASGAYRPDALFDQYTYYTTAPSNVARSGYPYAEMQYEPSPLNRVQQQAAPGEAWRLGSGREVTVDYLTNSGTEVRRWRAGSTLSADGTYGANELYKTVTTDEDDHTTTEFRNKLDQVVLRRVQGPTGNQDTYYVYDDFNLLRYVIPPEATQRLSGSAGLAGDATFQAQWLFVYRYDAKRRLTEQQTPGGGVTKLIYDRWDRRVLTQTALMREQNANRWQYTKYDALNRPVLTGLYVGSGENALRSAAAGATQRFETLGSGPLRGYSNQTFPSVSEATLRTVTYYDRYTFPHASAGGFSFSDDIAARSQRREVVGQVTGALTRKLDDNSWLRSVTYYDEQYRPIQALTENHLGGRDRITTEYRNTVNSDLLSTKRVHSSSNGNRALTQNYTYDHTGRLLSVTHQLDNQPAVTLAAHEYNALGELVEKQLGGGQQTVDYRYNIRGWLTRINELGSVNDYFSQRLHYDFGFEKKSYNGNVAGVQWQRAGGQAHAYGYLYDAANRVIGADYRQRAEVGSWATEPGSFSVDKVSYDRNGNIGELKRYGEQDERLYLWDDLSYTYRGNQLLAVQDAGEAETGFVDGASSVAEYAYDGSGNLTRDDNKGITSITYDPVLNLPTEVVIDGRGTIKYTYDAAGTKLRQQVIPTDGSPTKTTDYVSGFHYQDQQLAFIRHEEGRLIVKDGLAYQYDLKDHLGNTRVTFSDTPVTTTAQATMEAAPAVASVEEAVFERVAESRHTLAFHNTTEASSEEPEPNQVATLRPGQQGPTKSVTGARRGHNSTDG